MAMPYRCENDECELAGKILSVPRGSTADCPKCGWSLTPVDDSDPALD